MCFEREFEDAKAEVARLETLLTDVCWYNFETVCRAWDHPWPKSQPTSAIQLHAIRQKRWFNKGHLREQVTFPLYFKGVVQDAPALPPQVVLGELLQAREYMQFCEEQVSAPYDWAPGGHKYEALAETTLVGRFSNESSGDGGEPE